MKKLFIIALVAISFAACKSKDTASTTNKDLLLLTDSSNLNQGSYLTDTGIAVNAASQQAATTPAQASPGKTTVIYRDRPTSSGNTNTTTSQSNQSSSSTTASRKTGISKGAKGAIIGGIGGAVGGAIIGKNAKGAAIGAAVGAAGGYIIGHSKDKKDGRIQ